MSLTLDDIDRITGDRIGKFDLPCPLCGPHKSRQGQQRKVLRVRARRVTPGAVSVARTV